MNRVVSFLIFLGGVAEMIALLILCLLLATARLV